MCYLFETIYQEKGGAFSQDHTMLTDSSAVIFCFPSTQLNVVMFTSAGQSTSLLMGDL